MGQCGASASLPKSLCCGNSKCDEFRVPENESSSDTIGVRKDSTDAMRFEISGDVSDDPFIKADNEVNSDTAQACNADLDVKMDSMLTIVLHCAKLVRSFAKIGTMDPYAVIHADGKEIFRTPAHTGAHKSPVWEVSMAPSEIPESITISVWDKNNFHRDVFCGSVDLPCPTAEGTLTRQEFQIEKRDRPTGTLTLSMSFAEGGQVMALRTEASIGGEFDDVIDSIVDTDVATKRSRTITMRSASNLDALVEEDDLDHNHSDDKEATSAASFPLRREPSMPTIGFQAGALVGTWKCVATQGLEEFMIATGVGMFQRTIALKARWPEWEFAARGRDIVFVNHSAIGALREEINLHEEYQWKDGKNNQWTCVANWANSETGGTLRITRNGSMGEYTEERVVGGDNLTFVLKNPKVGVSWGRSFVRAHS
mmetsp:Transcript_95500/g.270088  ORF Transcript_95500/g.270088 Transcript_95500/m.270088 type:complete len:426 (+) Transcript_95500:77-1354(+)